MRVLCFVFVALFTIGTLARAQDRTFIYGELRGSTFFIIADNSRSTGFRCSAKYRLTYSQYGSPGSVVDHQSFYVPPKLDRGIVFRRDTSWAASTLNYELDDVACSPDSPGSSGPKVVTDDDRERITEPRPICPAGLTYINEAYGESSSGGGNFLAEMPIYFPENFRLNPTYRQQGPAQPAGGSREKATSPWNGLEDIPPGILLVTSGAHYWAVGVAVPGRGDGKPKLFLNPDGTARALTIGMYCGPAGRPGPGCNVRVRMCAMRG